MRMKSLVLGDLRSLWKYGFFAIYAIVCAVYIAIIHALPAPAKPQLTAILLFSAPGALGLFFMGAIVLLEKSQRTANAIAVSPVRNWEYIGSKVISLGALSCTVALAIAVTTGSNGIAGILLGTLLTASLFTLIGLAAATKIASLNQFLMNSAMIELFCFLPPILALLLPQFSFLRLYPVDACLRLIAGTSRFPALDVGIALLLNGVAALFCHRRVSSMFREMGGAKL